MAKKTKQSAGSDLSHIAEGLRALAVPIAEIVPDPANARVHDEKNLAAIKASLRRFGQVSPLIVEDGTNVLRAGHGRLLAAQQLYAEGHDQWSQMAVLRAKWDPSTGTAFAIADNRSAELAEWDKAALEAQLRNLDVEDEDLEQMFADLAEDLELVVDLDDVDAGDDDDREIPERFQIMITCADENHQKELLAEFERRALECRALTS